MRAPVAILAAAALLTWFAEYGGAYSTSGRRWPSGSNIVMHLQFGSSSGTLIDGSSSWNTPAENALSAWNPFMNGVSFSVVRDSSAGNASGNRINNVGFADDVYGEPFGSDVLAVAQQWYRTSDNAYTETDVVFNRKYTWNSYRGNRRSGTIDLRRVALHEFGHALGLSHPDDHNQSVSAIMNSRIGDVDSLQSDDTSGARAIYGGSSTPAPAPTNRPPTVTAGCNPCTVQAGQTSSLSATASDADGDSLTYQWTTASGSFSNSTTANTVWTATAQTGTFTATVTVNDGRSGRATATVTLQVVPRDTLQPGARLLPGQALTSANGRYRLVYQTDGNLVLYDDGDRVIPWASGTGGTAAGQAIMQHDGNFVVYDAQLAGIWATGTAGGANARLVLQNDGNLVVYSASGVPLWGR